MKVCKALLLNQCHTQSFFGIHVHVPGTGLERKNWRAHRQTDRLTKVMALFSCFSMQTTKQSCKIIRKMDS